MKLPAMVVVLEKWLSFALRSSWTMLPCATFCLTVLPVSPFPIVRSFTQTDRNVTPRRISAARRLTRELVSRQVAMAPAAGVADTSLLGRHDFKEQHC